MDFRFESGSRLPAPGFRLPAWAPMVDLRFLDRALDLAEEGRYTVSPNPMVGSVLVQEGRVVGEGFHQRAGGRHAEIHALQQAAGKAAGADLYITLEPCVHSGRTPPCVPQIIAAGVRRVVFGARDPDPRVSGRGLAALRRAGLEVLAADREREARAAVQNEKFRVWVSRGRPFVLAKWAATLDGKTASGSGASRWITGRSARLRALLFREEYDAVLVGAGTVRSDDPLLTRRLGRNALTAHWRVVLDGRLRIPEEARLFRQTTGVIVATALPADHPRARRLAERGVGIWSLPGSAAGRVSVRRLLSRMARQGISSLMVEGGAETLWGFFAAGVVDRVAVFTAPRVLGGAVSPAGVGGAGFSLDRAPEVRDVSWEAYGRDWLVTGRVKTT
jgi:diaminohydroxyphosphoribosylaminopyrimidine deaminase/5-amino-6-(5-phosphoribosylamino)uracil reductase